MSRRFTDPSLQGMRTLEVWAGKSADRRFKVEWNGPRRGRLGGYYVKVWSSESEAIGTAEGVTLQDAALAGLVRF